MTSRLSTWLILGLTLTFLIGPFLIIIAAALSAGNNLAFPPQGLSLKWFIKVFEVDSFRASFGVSMFLAIFGTVVALILGVPAAYALARNPGRASRVLEEFISLPLAIPGLALALALLQLYGSYSGFRTSWAFILVGHVLYTLPFMVRSVLAVLAAIDAALADLPVRSRLRVGVLSTGDEIVPDPADPALPHQIWDANRPMLLALAAGWHCVPVDLGHVRDDRALIRDRLDEAAGQVDVILTSGGASAGDEDHVSALLRAQGTLSSWRIALKPGRPLALALWQGVPVFGLPGNPVAALVCALVFARPALSLLAGAGWVDPVGFTVPAGFSKSKKPGRREYLRARLTAEGTAEVFGSEGSGRISGLS